MLARALIHAVALLLVWLASGSPARAESSPWRVPGDVSELQRACAEHNGLQTFAQSGYLGIECGYQALLLGSKLPIGPAAHVRWAKPQARGPIKLPVITEFGNASADDAGGLEPGLWMGGVRLLVRQEDVGRAVDVLGLGQPLA